MTTSVIIDPGHGGTNPNNNSSPSGVCGPRGTQEKDVTLALARAVAAQLGSDVALTRTDDRNLSLAQRADAARRAAARVFISLHANGGSPGARGASTFVHDRANNGSRMLASRIHRALVGLGGPDGGVRPAQMAVLTPERLGTDTAACLVEVDYLSDPQGERRLCDPDAVEAMATAIAGGVRDFLGVRGQAAPRSQSFGRGGFVSPHGLHEQYDGRFGQRAAKRAPLLARAQAVPTWDLPANFPTAIREMWARPDARLIHHYWHMIRINGWSALSSDEQKDATRLGLGNSPRPNPTDPGFGIDFFCMHRKMIETTRAKAIKLGIPYRPTGWSPIPWDHNDPTWPMPAATDPDVLRSKNLGDKKTPGTTLYYKDQVSKSYWNDDWMAAISLDDLGKDVEDNIHGWMHMHWSTDPPADPKDTSIANDWLGTFFSSAVNPHFWKLHGFIDDLIGRWELAPTKTTGANKGPKRDANAAMSSCWAGTMPKLDPASAKSGLFSSSGQAIAFMEDGGDNMGDMPGMGPAEPLSDEELQAMVDRVDLSRTVFPNIGMDVDDTRVLFAINAPFTSKLAGDSNDPTSGNDTEIA